MTKDEAIAILKGPYSHQIREVATSYTSVLFWGRPEDPVDTPRIGNGSVFFLDCGDGLLAVTADHVYEEYLSRRQAEPDLVCQIGNVAFLPEEHLIDRDAALDIATFRITEQERELKFDGKIAHSVNRRDWPPRPPEEGKGVFFTGFPRVYSTKTAPNRCAWGSYSAILTATSVSATQVACQFHRAEMVDAFGTGLPPQGEWLGGLSGAPLWTLVQTSVFSWRLAGVIYEYSEHLEVLFARRPDCIASNGTLIRERSTRPP